MNTNRNSEISIKYDFRDIVIVEYTGKEYHLPPWGGGPSLVSEWAKIEAMMVARKMTYTHPETGQRIGYLSGRYVDNGKPIPGADPFPGEDWLEQLEVTTRQHYKNNSAFSGLRRIFKSTTSRVTP